MLPDLVGQHPPDLLHLKHLLDLLAQVDQPVYYHSADDQHYYHDIYFRDSIGDRCGRDSRRSVNRRAGKSRGNIGVTFSTGFLQVTGIDR